ncbi:MAG: ligase-associated DNA damage response exonuclease [Candidatus Obscuribacterales bacterium]|jgi:putative mRNA 3-end processing factor|nr:ligase-associated DNA damage response exonuclease [Candidatus Obscuribacterales bacterium]
MSKALVTSTNSGLYCPQGDFYIDPWRGVDLALVTHAHSDHARSGSKCYLTSEPGQHVLRARLDPGANVESIAYGKKLTIKDVTVSFHPAGHVLGSAQIRIEHKGQVWVVSGDYKTQLDPTCEAIEPIQCHTFITESTFGLPIYRWPSEQDIESQINGWWQRNKEQGRASVLFAYSFGKAQRILSLVDSSIGPIFVHGAVHKLNEQYTTSGVTLPDCKFVGDLDKKADFKGGLIIAPPAAFDSPWTKRFGDYSSGYASGWMRVRGNRRRQSIDRGFTLSDHADWNGLLEIISATGAEEIIVTHGFSQPLIKYLRETGKQARGFKTEYRGEESELAIANEKLAEAYEEDLEKPPAKEDTP